MRGLLESAAESYSVIFGDWLDIHYAARTLILILLACMIIYVCAQFIQYAALPLLILFFYHALYRAWNYCVTETFQEWIFIHYYSEDKPFLRNTYLRLCDRIKRNRLVLKHTRYSGIMYRGVVQKIAKRLMTVAMVISCLWILAFGLYNEFAYGIDKDIITTGASGNGFAADETPDIPGDEAFPQTEPLVMNPATWPEEMELVFTLNARGAGGSNIRDNPGVNSGTPVAVVNGDALLVYLNEYAFDDSSGVYWLKVRAPSGVEGYISCTLLDFAE